jgi:iron(III) transport system substrate-binding protein
MALLKSAKHPAASVLFADWLVGPGQEVLLESNQEAARRDLSQSRGAVAKPIDVVEFESQTKEWDDRYEKLISDTPKAPEPE